MVGLRSLAFLRPVQIVTMLLGTKLASAFPPAPGEEPDSKTKLRRTWAFRRRYLN